MKDIARKIDLLKDLINRPGQPNQTEQKEIGCIAVDFIGELIANSRRIATALEAIAKHLEPTVENAGPEA